MNLGLLDILTMQQAERANPSRGQAAYDLSSDDKNFKEYLKTAKSENNASSDNNAVQKENTAPTGQPKADKSENQNQTPKIRRTADETGQVPNFSAATATEIQNGLTQHLLGGIEIIADQSGDLAENSVLASLLGLQEVATTPSNTELLGAPKEISLQSFNNTPQEVAAKVVSQTIANITANNGEAPSSAEIEKIVLNLAKIDAQSPEVSETNIKSAQVVSLLGKKELGGDKNQTGNTTSNNKPVIDEKIIGLMQQDASKTRVVQPVVDLREKILATNLTQTQEEFLGNKTAGQTGAGTSTNSSELLNQMQNNSSENSGFKEPGSGQNLPNNSNINFNSASLVKFDRVMETTGISASDMALNKSNFENAAKEIANIKFSGSNTAGKGNNTITIQLHPKELGSIDVKMEIAADGKTKVTIMAEKADTLNLLQKEGSSLREILQDSLKTESSNLSFNFQDKGHEQWKQFNENNFGNQVGALDDDEVANFDNISGYANAYLSANEGLDISV